LILIENDHSKTMHVWKEKFPQAIIFYPGYSSTKNPPIGKGDQIFNPALSMAENVALAMSPLKTQELDTCNGIAPLSHLKHRRFPNRIIIHPTSSSTEKNWHPSAFIKLHRALQKKGYDPVFVMSPAEQTNWRGGKTQVATFPNLSELAAFVYESGAIIGNDSLIGHLGSNLELPTLIIANDGERMRLWKPGWKLGEILTPKGWIPNCKGLRLRKNQWRYFISLKRVLSTFEKLVRSPTPPSPQ
jgi:heptosyltransferase-3